MNDATRRSFLKGAAAAAPIAALGAVAAKEAVANSPLPAPRAVAPGQFFSQAVVYAGIAHIAGVMGTKPGTWDLVSPDFESQARQAMDNLKASIEAAGSKLDRVLKCNCFLSDGADFAAFNKIYKTYFPTNPPARSTVVVKALVLPAGKIEIDCIAAV